ncbi:hypothetical protein G7072_08145 [Nocardioides sp. HDW12B]|uniref:hypothetical protein n=1 Tax=Nocardioides sp. HDW12B TaxID=2714939 RepID=UPI00140D2A90|nr:hypothetical protein [Nocardioides sp. HDW12B]QIK66328.1 hypothetical protein G7072_08145 [Nocardioides sp. HDW12B]
MREVLVFAEAELDRQRQEWLLERLHDLRHRPVICQVHLRPLRHTSASALPAQTPRAAEERDVELARARRRLGDLVELVRGAGHVAHGELLVGPLVRALARGIAERSPEEVVLVTADRRLELLLRRDLERRPHHVAAVPVRVLDGSSGLPRG